MRESIKGNWVSITVCIAGSEFDEEDGQSDNNSDDSWTTQEEFTSELILRYRR